MKFKTQSAKFKVMLLFTFSFLLLTFPVHAQVPDFGQSQITPASPLYFLKSVREIIELKLAGTTRIKAFRQLEFATRRIKETNSLVGTSREDLIEPTLARYRSTLDELRSVANMRDEDMVVNMSEGIPQQMDILQRIYGQVSDTKAKRSIRATINSLSQWEQQLIDKLDLAKQPVMAQVVVRSKLSGCNFLSKEASSSALNEVDRGLFFERAQKCLTIGQ